MPYVEPITVTRSYLYTYLTSLGEEGPPSDPTTKTGNVGETWTITVPDPSGGVQSGRLITQKRLYRTVVGANGVASYYLVTTLNLGTTSYADALDDEDITSNIELASTGWIPPPTTLQGIVSMPNGILAGWKDNEIWFCEPYRPHAWPAAYQVSTDAPIIGLGVVGQTLVVCTTGSPWLCSGVHPSTMSLAKVGINEPCVSRASIVSTTEGVFYASPNGLVAARPGQVGRVTVQLISPSQWDSYFDLPSLCGVMFNNAYLAYERAAGATSGCLIDVTNQRAAFVLLESTSATVNFYMDLWSGFPMMIRSGSLYRIPQPDNTNLQPYLWRSKEFTLSSNHNLAAAKIMFTVPSGAPTLNGTPNTNLVQTLAADQYGLFRVYRNGTLIYTRELRTSNEIFKLPSGARSDVWQVEVEARVIVKSIQLGTSTRELRSV